MKNLVICIDAFRYDYISPELTPFLNGFEKRELKPSFEYGISSHLLTGKDPEKNNTWVNFKLNKKSVYKKLTFLKNRRLIELISNLIRIKENNYFLSGTYSIPLEMLPDFDLQIKKSPFQKKALKNKSIFDLLDESGKKYLVLDWPLIATNKKIKIDYTTKTDEGLIEGIIKHFSQKINFYYAHIRSVDLLGHLNGPLDIKTKKRVKKIDKLTRRLTKEFLKKFPEGNVILFSDHGMEKVKGYINLEKTKKFCNHYFFDSTIARFWPKDKTGLINFLKKQKHGKVLNENDKKRLGIKFSHTLFGEIFFAVEPGFVIHPDFFHGERKVQGMHTYYKESKGNNGFFITNKKITFKKRKITMKDLHKLIKKIIEGKKL